jgi:hypothetical protein
VLVTGAEDPLVEALDALPANGRLLLAVDQLEEIRLAAVELRIDADLVLGRHHQLVGELERSQDPELHLNGLPGGKRISGRDQAG